MLQTLHQDTRTHLLPEIASAGAKPPDAALLLQALPTPGRSSLHHGPELAQFLLLQPQLVAQQEAGEVLLAPTVADGHEATRELADVRVRVDEILGRRNVSGPSQRAVHPKRTRTVGSRRRVCAGKAERTQTALPRVKGPPTGCESRASPQYTCLPVMHPVSSGALHASFGALPQTRVLQASAGGVQVRHLGVAVAHDLLQFAQLVAGSRESFPAALQREPVCECLAGEGHGSRGQTTDYVCA